MYDKIYRKLFLRYALKLFLSGVSLKFINFFTHLFFSRAKKHTRLLIYSNRLLNQELCKCQKLHAKCRYLEKKLKKPSNKILPVWEQAFFCCLFVIYLKNIVYKNKSLWYNVQVDEIPWTQFAGKGLSPAAIYVLRKIFLYYSKNF